MLELIQNLDASLLHFLNVTLANPVCDRIMPIITDDWFVRIFFAFFALLAIIFGGKYGRITALLLILTVILTDSISAQLIKPWVGRLRPCKTYDWVHLLVNCSSAKSFPSSHAANSFGQAMIWSWRYPKFKWFFLLSAFVIAYSRICVGVHYPTDFLAGAILGVLCALALRFVVRKLNRLKAGYKSA